MSKISKKTPIIKKKCSIKKLAEQYELDAEDYEELLKRIKLDIRRHKKIIKSKKSTKKDIEDSKRKLEGLLCSQAVLKERIYEEAGVSTETINKPKSASEEQKLINFLLSKAVKEPPKENVKAEAEKKVESLTPLTKSDFYKKSTKDQKKDLDEALNKMEEIKKNITQKVIVTPVEKEELKLIKQEIKEVGSVRSSLNDPTVKVVPAAPIPAAPVPAPGLTKKYSKKKKEIKDLKKQLEEIMKNNSEKEKELQKNYNKLLNDFEQKNREMQKLNNESGNFIQELFSFENKVMNIYDDPVISDMINKDSEMSDAYNHLLKMSNELGSVSGNEITLIKNDMQNINSYLIKRLNKMIDLDVYIEPKYEQLKKEINEIENSLRPLKNKKQKYRERYDELLLEISANKKMLENTENVLDKTKNENKILSEQINELIVELNNFSNSKIAVEELNKKLTEDIKLLSSQRSDLTDEIENLQAVLEQKVDPLEVIKLKNELNVKEIELNKINEQYQILSNEYIDVREMKNELINEFKKKMEEFNALKKYSLELNNEFDKIEKSNLTLQEINTQYAEEIKSKHDNIKENENIIQNTFDVIGEYEDDFNSIEKELKDASEKRKEYQRKIELYSKLKKEISENKKKFLKEAAQTLNLRTKKANKKDITSSGNEDLIKTYEIIEQESEKNKAIYDEAVTEDKKYEKVIDNLHEKLKDIKLNISENNEKLDLLLKKNANIQIKQINEIENIENKIDEKNEEIEEKQEKKEVPKEEIEVPKEEEAELFTEGEQELFFEKVDIPEQELFKPDEEPEEELELVLDPEEGKYIIVEHQEDF